MKHQGHSGIMILKLDKLKLLNGSIALSTGRHTISRYWHPHEKEEPMQTMER